MWQIKISPKARARRRLGDAIAPACSAGLRRPSRNRHHELFVGIFKDTMTHNPATSLERYDALWGISENQVNQAHSAAWKDLVEMNMRHNFIMADSSFSHNAAMALQTLAFDSRARIVDAGMNEIMAWVAEQARLSYPNWKEMVSSQNVPQNSEQQITGFFDNMRSLMGSGTSKVRYVHEFGPWFAAILEHNGRARTNPTSATPPAPSPSP